MELLLILCIRYLKVNVESSIFTLEHHSPEKSVHARSC